MKILSNKGTQSIALAKIVAAKSQTSKSGKHQVVLSVENGDDKPIAVFFTDQSEGKGLASRLDKLAENRPIVGMELFLDLTAGNDGVYFANAFGFHNRGLLWRIGQDDDVDYVIAGHVTGLRDWGDGNLEVTIPVNRWDKDQQKEVPSWYRINFFKDDAAKIKGMLAGEKVSAVIRCTGRREKEVGERTYVSFVGHEVTVLN